MILAADFLKIDGAFTQGILDDSVDRAVIHAINAIAHSVGKRTTAEYVDRPELIAALKAAGVDFLQGYYIGRPLENLRRAVAQTGAPIAARTFDSRGTIPNEAHAEVLPVITPIALAGPEIIPFPTRIEIAAQNEIDAFSADLALPAVALPEIFLLDDRLQGNG